MRAEPLPVVALSFVRKSAVFKPVALIPLVAAVLLPGCAAQRADTAKLDCTALHQVVDAAQGDLSGLAATRTNTTYGSVWHTKVAAYGSDCTLFGTTNVPNRYFCTIPAAADSPVLVALRDEVASCLGAGWQRNPSSDNSGERFSRPGSDIMVDVGASDANASRAKVIGLLVHHRRP